MNNRLLATGAALSLALGGCGGQSHETITETNPVKHDNLGLRADQQLIQAVIDRTAAVHDSGVEFTDLDPKSVRELGEYTVKIFGKTHTVVGLTDTSVTKEQADSVVGLYANAQQGGAHFAKRFPRLSIPLFDAKTGERVGAETVKLKVFNDSPRLVLTAVGDFSTDVATEALGLAAVSYRPKENPRLQHSISFIQPDPEVQYELAAIGTEAMQTLLDVQSGHPKVSGRLAQEEVANSLGTALANALAGVAYEDYVKFADLQKADYATLHGDRITHDFVVSPKLYAEFKNHQMPTSLAGSRLAKSVPPQ